MLVVVLVVGTHSGASGGVQLVPTPVQLSEHVIEVCCIRPLTTIRVSVRLKICCVTVRDRLLEGLHQPSLSYWPHSYWGVHLDLLLREVLPA